MAPCCAAALYFPYIILASILEIARAYTSQKKALRYEWETAFPFSHSKDRFLSDKEWKPFFISEMENKKLTLYIIRIITTEQRGRNSITFSTQRNTHTKYRFSTIQMLVFFSRHFVVTLENRCYFCNIFHRGHESSILLCIIKHHFGENIWLHW